ncbi:MAG: nitric-oxide reductase large subunit [Acetobacteraceae bacterium]
MSATAPPVAMTRPRDGVTNVLKWTLLALGLSLALLLVLATIRTYRESPPIPEAFVSPSGLVVMTRADLFAGKAGFQKADLMDYGSLYGMGSYFGPDFTAKYLVALARGTEDAIGQARFGKPFAVLNPDQQVLVKARMRRALQGIRLGAGEHVVLPAPVVTAIEALRPRITHWLLTTNLASGYTRAASLDPRSALKTADFLLYSALTTVARRPNGSASWTNNWPYEPLVGNGPTTATFIWTWVSFMTTFLLFGVVIWAFENVINTPDTAQREFLFARFVPLTPSQRAVGKYFASVALVLLLQIGVGGLMAHYYAERSNFYGLVLNNWLPFNALRAVHIQAPIVWIGVSWIGAALFLAPLIGGGEAKGQGVLVSVLFWVTIAVVGGALAGDYLGIMGIIRHGWFWFGNQGLSYIELGRFWQIGFAVGLALWCLMMARALWPRLEQWKAAVREFLTGAITLEHLFWAASINIAVLYWFGMIPLSSISPSFTITDYWRWWVVHLWVEQSFEFFAAVVTAYLLVATGLVSRRLAERTVLFETVLVFLGGMLGTGHHWYWVGEPSFWVPVGSMFSFIEVLPLLLLVMEAAQQRRLIRDREGFPYGLAYTYIIGAAVWNFVGAGVFGGGLLNAPLINYYEHATTLTLNHAHTALFGAFGMLAIGMIYFCLRYAAGEDGFDERWGRMAFWLFNAGMVMWTVLTFFPVGFAQLAAVYEHGLAYARSLKFNESVAYWQWLRMFGDIVFALGALVMAADFLRKLTPFYRVSARIKAKS